MCSSINCSLMIRIFISALLTLAFCSRGEAEVIIEDGIAVRGMAYMLTAKTMGRFFPAGGEVVEFFTDDSSLGKNLSGGDGRALKEFIPERKGLYRIEAVSVDDRDRGLLLVLDRNEGILCVDIEGSLFRGKRPLQPDREAKEHIARIAREFPLVYLSSTILGTSFLRDWLGKHAFAIAPVLQWSGGDVFKNISGLGLKVRGIIGGADVIASARKYTSVLLSFDKTEGAVEIKEWNEVYNKLKEALEETERGASEEKPSVRTLTSSPNP